jgi:riboflavin biosynthesis pyrimidine reductase
MKIVSVFEHPVERSQQGILPESLAALYDGNLSFPPIAAGRPVIIGNFVESLDGIVSLKIPHQSDGSVISGCNDEDRFIMGLLRACADAVMVATGTLHESPGHLWTPEFIYPTVVTQFVQFRASLGKTPPHPRTVIVSGSGHINLAERVFSSDGTQPLILTTAHGQAHLARQYGSDLVGRAEVRILPGEDELDPADIAGMLHTEYGVNVLLHEGGAHFFSAFLKRRLVDELFLTIAPQIVGSGLLRARPTFAVTVNFDADEAIWGSLLSVKRPNKGSHLYLRYRL